MNNFRQFLNESRISSMIDRTFGKDNFGMKVKRFLTLDWIDPISGAKAAGIRALKKAGFADEEITAFRSALIQAFGEAVNEFDPGSATKYDGNFKGWITSVDSLLGDLTDNSRKTRMIRDTIISRVIEILGDSK